MPDHGKKGSEGFKEKSRTVFKVILKYYNKVGGKLENQVILVSGSLLPTKKPTNQTKNLYFILKTTKNIM